jgi:outer membrane receptor protein involved in Fe transport
MAKPDRSRWRRAALAVAAAVALATWPADTLPQGDDSGKIDVSSLDLRSLLDPAVEVVGLREERASDASASVFVLSAEDIRRHGFRTLEEALRAVPGLFTYADGLGPMAGVRGLGLLGDRSTRLLMLVDGHPLNDSVAMGGSHLGRDLPVPMAAVRRIEVVKGPVGSVYGPTAFLGAVNVVTASARPGLELTALGEGAQGGIRAGEASLLGSGDAHGIAWLASVAGYRTRGLDWTFPEYARADPPDPAGGRIGGRDSGHALQSYARLTWRDLTLSGSCGRLRTGVASPPYSSLLRDDRNDLENRDCFAEAGFSRALSPEFTLQLRASYDDVRYRDRFAYPPPPDGRGAASDYGRDRWFSIGARATWDAFRGTRVVAGTDGERHDTAQRAYGAAPADPLRPVGEASIDRTFWTLHAYSLLEQALGSRVVLHAGLTFYAHELFGSRLTPKVAAVWRPTRGDTVKVIYSEGFRPPTVSEALFDDGATYLANRSLRPETVRSLELAYERRLGDAASVSASIFQNTYRDLIGLAAVLPPGAPPPERALLSDYRSTAVNLDSLRVRGGEIGLRLSWRERLEGWAGLSIQHVDRPDQPNFPALTASFALSSRAPWRPLTLSVHGSALSARARDPVVSSLDASARVGPAFTIGALGSLEVPGARGLSLELGVENLLGARRADPVPGRFAPLSEISGPPPTLRACLRYRH